MRTSRTTNQGPDVFGRLHPFAFRVGSLILLVGIVASCGNDGDVGNRDTPPGTGVTTSAPQQTTTSAAPNAVPAVSCEDISFAKESDGVASSIRATGVACSQAATLVRAVQSRYAAEKPIGHVVGGVPIGGYSCTGVLRDNAPAHFAWTCTKNEAKVTFSKY